MRHLHAFLLAILLPFSAIAATAPAPASKAATPAALQPLVSSGAILVKSFPAPDGLTGWVVKVQGHQIILYTTSSGAYAFSAPLVDKDGINVTQQYVDKYISGPAAETTAQTLAQDPYLVQEGAATAPLLYVYADANCSFCNKLWTALRPYVQSGKVRVSWAMVAFLKDSSLGRAAAILDAKDRAAALALDEEKFDQAKEEGGIPPLDPIPDALRASITAHSIQMGEAGGQGTPFMVFRKGGQWVVIEGLRQDISSFVAAMDPAK